MERAKNETEDILPRRKINKKKIYLNKQKMDFCQIESANVKDLFHYEHDAKEDRPTSLFYFCLQKQRNQCQKVYLINNGF
jgi:hypothetical protein